MQKIMSRIDQKKDFSLTLFSQNLRRIKSLQCIRRYPFSLSTGHRRPLSPDA